MRRSLPLAAAALLLALPPRPAGAEPLIIGLDQGAVFDAIIDGFPMLALFDGVPDFLTGYNTLSIGLQLGVTEERGVGEFPVAPLAGVAPAAVRRATLHFNIDDVIGTFGPGTSFRGSASQRILVHLYAGDGTVTVDDHLAIERAAHVVDTTPLGRITDATLARSGPLAFALDVTDDLRALLAAAPVAVGVVWRTTDSPSATSLDHLGDGSAGPPFVNGAFLPYLTIELDAVAAPTATPTATAEPPATATATAMATATASPTGAATTTPGGVCAGDCDGDGQVSINEVILGVGMGLGGSAACPAMDGDSNGTISIDELVRAVNAALGGC
jgi:hypothetical protein